LESLAFGVPCVLNLTGGLAAYECLPGVRGVPLAAGSLVPFKRGAVTRDWVLGLAEGLADVIPDLGLWRARARVAGQYVLENYSPEFVADRLEEIYLAALG
jgi:glycosyltransferase involved in cell wall biosynthesis